jgi:hypothetical protein
VDTIARHGGRLLTEAARLARKGELGNSDAISLLQIPHRPEELKDALRTYDAILTREARAKLALWAITPLPAGVDNQRHEPIFDRYPISGRTYTTASGTVVPNEVQYYNGEMVQLYGCCPNVARVAETLASSGYKPVLLKHRNGTESAVCQFWSHRLSDTSLGPYDAMFIIVVAVPDTTPVSQSCIVADDNAAACVLPMFDGSYDPERGRYENRAVLYYVS